MRKLLVAAVAVVLAAPAAWAYGPHDPNCVECHSIHYAKGRAILAVAPNTAEKNPATGKNAADDAALCLGCHNEDEGIIPIHLAQTHPVGMKPKKVKVPADLLRKDGTLGCTSCHNPHPSNPNYKYLRGTVAKGSELGKFCAICHGDKVDKGAFAKAPSKKK
ncbi:cytochrome c3 family protein [Deferrisoma camini]|uniref:cytochrome c3 family protein n=1 Tax=Deferrisoma camini TaxID=1035120 RepID=UPI00046C9AF4|nr:cytochrome c3 family protein [Deferrisoma camini]